MRYFAVDASGRGLGCLIFKASGSLACHDAGLALVARNSRFLIYTRVEAKNLASRSLAARRRRRVEDAEGRLRP